MRRHDRLRPLAAGLDLDRDLERALRLDDLLEEVAERHRAEEGGLVLVERGELGQDVAAALDLLAQELEVVRHRPLLRQGVVELLGDERDRRERRAELVRGGGGEPVELRQVLLAGEHQLGRGERLGELARLLGDAPGIDADEGDAEQDRDPDAGDVEERQRRRSARHQGSGRWASTRIEAEPTARQPSASVRSGGSAVAEIRTGARNSIANGFCRPPVR